MNQPRLPDSPIDAQRFKLWLAGFSSYRTQVTQSLVEIWLEQFKLIDRDLAARLLDAVLFIGTPQIHNQYRDLLASLQGWHKEEGKRIGRWFFVAFSGSAGESGDSMVHAFRQANGMTRRSFNSLFVHRSELVALKLGQDDTVVLLDDFSGSGKQAVTSWRDVFQELISGCPKIILMLVAATTRALKAISDNTEMEPICGTTLQPRDDFFSADCNRFSTDDKDVALKYCKIADRNSPRGWSSCGLLVVLAHRCPNNMIPVLHVSNAKWQGLFPRND